MKKNKLILILFIVLAVFSCKNYNHKSNEDKLLLNYFSKQEIKDLEKILNFFENEICKENNSNIEACYKSFLKKADINYKNKDFKISLSKQNELIKNISKSTYNKIWINGISFKNNHKDTIKIMMLNTKSTYMNFIKEINKDYINEYYNLATGFVVGINAGTTNFMINNYDEFNIKEKSERLIIAIHFLTINNQLCSNTPFN